jgi:hypothetical protein
MSKTILLELTERETELLQKAISTYLIKDRDMEKEDIADHDKRIARCNSILTKASSALQTQEDHIASYEDLLAILSMAKDQYLALPADLHISKKKIREEDYKHIAIVNSVIVWLNGNRLLKRLATFNVTDHSCDFEDNND